MSSSFFLFSPIIALMANDANHVMGARRFLKDGIFPLAHGATHSYLNKDDEQVKGAR
jgi:hypothetical protein